MTSQPELIREADWVLSKCGRPTAPKGLASVYIPHSFLLQTLTQSSGQVTVEKEITGPTTWVLRAISLIGYTSYWQVLLPNGQLLINSLQAEIQAQGFGSGRYVFPRELHCTPGSKITVTFSAVSYAALALFEGAYLSYVKNGSAPQASQPFPPKYASHPNQNPLAPCWMRGMGPETPDGYEDSPFVYSSSVSTGLTGTGANAFGSVQIPIENSADFVARRFLFDPSQDAGVTAGTILVRIRAASGHVLNDDYTDLGRYIGSAPLGHDWWIKAGDALIAELQLVDYAGTYGSKLYMRVHVEGCKRKQQ